MADSALTIDDMTALALSHHPASRVVQAEIEAAQAQFRQAAVRPNPELEIGVGLKESDAESGFVADAALSITIERKGKREARKGIAQGELAVAEATRATWQRDVVLQVRMLAYEWLSASAGAEIAGEIAERSRAMIELLKQRPVAGPAMLLELRVIEASLVEFQKSARDFAAQRDVAQRSLNLLMGRMPDAPLRIADKFEVPTASYALDSLMAQLEKNPGLLKRLAEVKRAAQEAEAARLEANPDYRLSPYVSREDSGESETTVGLAVNLPIYWRNRNQGALAAASAKLATAEAQVAADLLNARMELSRIHRLYEAAMEQINAIPSDRLAKLHDAADLADRQYRLGAISVQLFLDVQREFLAVQSLRHNALLEALKRAAELDWLAGSAATEDAP